jgi:hypothetical protein
MPDKTSAVPGPVLDIYMRTPAVNASRKVGIRIRLFNLLRRGVLDPSSRRRNVNSDETSALKWTSRQMFAARIGLEIISGREAIKGSNMSAANTHIEPVSCRFEPSL